MDLYTLREINKILKFNLQLSRDDEKTGILNTINIINKLISTNDSHYRIGDIICGIGRIIDSTVIDGITIYTLKNGNDLVIKNEKELLDYTLSGYTNPFLKISI